jgi:hypothetical protein
VEGEPLQLPLLELVKEIKAHVLHASAKHEVLRLSGAVAFPEGPAFCAQSSSQSLRKSD